MKFDFRLSGTPLDKLLLGLSMAILVLCLSVYFTQRTSLPGLAKLKTQVESARRELQASASHADPEELKREIQELKSNSLAFPSSAQAEEAIASLWRWAQDRGVLLEQMAFNNTTGKVGDWVYPAHNFPISGKGSPESVSGFLNLLANSPLRTVGISQLQINRRTDLEWQFSLVYTVWSEGTKVTQAVVGSP